jgi:hypothetical protein
MTAIVAIILTSLELGRQTEDRLDASNALRRVMPVFADDVASATVVATNVDATSVKCGGAAALIEMRGRTFAEPTLVSPPVKPDEFSTAVAYVLGTGNKLTRLTCRAPAPSDGSTPPMAVPDTELELAPALAAATVTCTPDCASPDAVYTLTLTPVGGQPQSLTATRRTS